jgi:aldehyde:ferredoxin oxidoreductase
MSGEDFASMLTTLTGVSYTLDDYLRAGERIWNLERMFNLKAGFTSADDNLPERLLKCPIKTGPSKGEISHLGDMLPEYYQLRGWDEQGVPTPEKIKELALD